MDIAYKRISCLIAIQTGSGRGIVTILLPYFGLKPYLGFSLLSVYFPISFIFLYFSFSFFYFFSCIFTSLNSSFFL